ncbi:MAG TPA: zf-HC2 domain-containing protein, partial [Gemmatimonadales bacterium]|nr:zf-HC2 domain-containing protein [Gemmatimonadales bacterium]
MHLDAEHLQRLLDGELEPGAGASVRHHLESCVPCRDQVVVAEREIAEVNRLLGLLDHPAPRLESGEVMRTGSRALGWGRRAAILFLGLGLAGVAYAAPGSPVPAWLRSVAARMRPTPTRSAPAPAASTQSPDAGASGIAVSPGERMTVILPSPPGGVLAYVSLADSADLAVRVVSGRASFSSGIDRLAVETSDSSAVFRILVPRGASRVEIRAGGSRLFLKQGPHIATTAEQSAEGVYALRIPPRTP